MPDAEPLNRIEFSILMSSITRQLEQFSQKQSVRLHVAQISKKFLILSAQCVNQLFIKLHK